MNENEKREVMQTQEDSGEAQDTQGAAGEQTPETSGLQAAENRKCCAVLATALGLMAGIWLMVHFGSGAEAGQMIRMYICAASGLLLSFVSYKLMVKLIGDKPLFSLGLSGGEGGSPSRIYDLLPVAVSLVVFMTMQDIIDVIMYEYAAGTYLACYLLGTVMACIAVQSFRGGEGGAAKLAVLFACAFSLAVMFFYAYIPNPYNQSVWEVHHYNALMQTVHNVAFDQPFTWESSGIYGHYSLLMWPFLKLFGHGPMTITLLFVAGLFIAQGAFIATVFKVTKSSTLRACAILASAACCLSQYYGAVWPTRTLWPAIVLAYTVYGNDSPRAERRPGLYWGVGYALCGLAILWSTDSGIVATAAYTFCLWLRCWRTERIFSKKALKVYGLTILGCVGSFALMVGLINLYNLLCGGPLVLTACFFPLLGGNGYVSNLQDTMSNFDNLFYLPLIIFMLSITVGMMSLRGIDACRTDRLALAFCGLMGLGQSYYYLNRSNASWDCLLTYVLLCLTVFADFVGREKSRCASFPAAIKKGTGFAAMLFMGALMFVSIYGSPSLLNSKLFRGINDFDSFRQISSTIEREVPKDTYAFGYLTQEIYAYLGWDPQYHYRDTSDMFGTGIENVYEEMSRQNTMLVSSTNASTVQKNCPGFYRVKLIGYESEDSDGGFVDLDTSQMVRFYLMKRFDPGETLIDLASPELQDTGEGDEEKSDRELLIPMDLEAGVMYRIEVEFDRRDYEWLNATVGFVTDDSGEEPLGLTGLTGEEGSMTSAAIYTSMLDGDTKGELRLWVGSPADDQAKVVSLRVIRMIPVED